jgi:hypothetical protein
MRMVWMIVGFRLSTFLGFHDRRGPALHANPPPAAGSEPPSAEKPESQPAEGARKELEPTV